jgi:hypothetical protein
MIASIEPGLPGTGQLPVHLHTGRPTPWSEGCVVRFTGRSGNAWIGNLQSGYGYATKITEWPEADAAVVIAKGAVYFVRPDQPDDWRFIDLCGIDCVIAPSRDLALIATYTDVVVISTGGTEVWRRSVALDGVEITDVRNGVIHGNAGIDPPDEWHPFVLQLETGINAEQSREPEPPMTRDVKS